MTAWFFFGYAVCFGLTWWLFARNLLGLFGEVTLGDAVVITTFALTGPVGAVAGIIVTAVSWLVDAEGPKIVVLRRKR